MITWEDPPFAYGEEKGRYQDFADELRKHPGKWAKLPTPHGEQNRASNIKLGKLKAFQPAYSFEAVYRQGATYARYVGSRWAETILAKDEGTHAEL